METSVNALLNRILDTNTVEEGGEILPLHSNMDREEGELISAAFEKVQPATSLEIGCAYGISALFACDAMKADQRAVRHIVIDPMQSTQWRGIGIENLRRAGFGGSIELIEEGSETALPRLHAANTRIQAAIVDGWHTFDHALVDFFYVNRMLDVGGVVILDDTNWPGLARLANLINAYPAYEVIGTVGEPRREHGVKAVRTAVRRALAAHVSARMFRRSVDYPRCFAFQKVAEDTRNFDWHAEF
jgi:predicted O-methyltransferase YrrM